MQKNTNDTIVVISCGARKRPGIHPAKALYTGAYFRACLGWALSVAKPADIYILSAKYGLLALDDRIASYDVHIGQQNAIAFNAIYQQVVDRGLADKKCIAVGGRDYTGICKRIWKDCITPLEGKGRQGNQLRWLKYNRGKIA